MHKITKFANMISICETVSGKGSRAIMVEAIKSLDEAGMRLCGLALNIYVTFGIKQIPEPQFSSDEDADLELFFVLCDKLAARELTGNAAKVAIMDTLAEYTPATIELLSRVLRKNLQTKFATTIYNSAVPSEFQVPVFDVMLADKCETDEEMNELFSSPCIADYKYDGMRTIIVFEQGRISFFSREGIQMTHCDGLFDDDLKKIRQYLGYDFVLDAEQFSESWEQTMNSRKSGDSEAKNQLHLLAFFIMPLEDWKAQSCDITMEDNRNNLTKMCSELNLKKIFVTSARIVTGVDEIKSMLAEVTTPGFEEQAKGYEGLILKRPSAKYQWKRVMDWCKVKNFYDIDCVVCDMAKGNPNTKYSDVMGRVFVRGYTEDGILVEGWVGSGFTDDQRKNPEFLVGATIVVSYQEITKPTAKRPVPSLRFGTFVRVRDDKIVVIED